MNAAAAPLQGASLYLFLGLITLASLLIHGFLMLCFSAFRENWQGEMTVHLLIWPGLFYRLWDNVQTDVVVICTISLAMGFLSYAVPVAWAYFRPFDRFRQWLSERKKAPFDDNLLDN